jgi:transcription elongation GreA/GreB family factor
MAEQEEKLITKHGYEKIKKEIYNLEHIDLPQAMEKKSSAMGFGDFRENAELQAANEIIGGLIRRINFLKSVKMKEVDGSTLKNDYVMFGSLVEVENIATGEVLTFTIVGDLEVDIKKSFISTESPIAKAVLGKKPNTIVKYNTYKEETIKIKTCSINRSLFL